ncbi:MAG: restriction endonuclease subunit S, partial [Tissierellia bacterium]|nr:restriction endonuclease subunit S [Tissierellia bacterium]
MEERLMPELRFPEFSGEWEQRNLGEIVEYRNGNANEKNVVADGKYNLITLNSIDIDGNLKQEHSRVDEADWLLEKHDMVMVLSDIATGDFLG